MDKSFQGFLSNTPILQEDAEWATEGLHFLAQIIADVRGEVVNTEYDVYDNLLTANYGASTYDNDIFVMRAYCWCDGRKLGHEDGCPPNFEHYPSGLMINWYKYAGRGITSNKKPTLKTWYEIVDQCNRSVRNEK